MGKMKKKYMWDWIIEAQTEYKDAHNADSTLVYNDLIEIDKLDDDNISVFCLVQEMGNGLYKHFFKSDDIEVINGVCLTYKKQIKDMHSKGEPLYYRYITVPFDKVLFSYYETRPAK